jgi:hypothetical protein
VTVSNFLFVTCWARMRQYNIAAAQHTVPCIATRRVPLNRRIKNQKTSLFCSLSLPPLSLPLFRFISSYHALYLACCSLPLSVSDPPFFIGPQKYKT